jgi:hypothetical protein
MSLNTSALALESGKKSKSKLVLGFISMTALVLVSTVGIAGATNNGNNGNGNNGNGYGGNTANVDLDLDVSGDNNVINIVLKFFFG